MKVLLVVGLFLRLVNSRFVVHACYIVGRLHVCPLMFVGGLVEWWEGGSKARALQVQNACMHYI